MKKGNRIAKYFLIQALKWIQKGIKVFFNIIVEVFVLIFAESFVLISFLTFLKKRYFSKKPVSLKGKVIWGMVVAAAFFLGILIASQRKFDSYMLVVGVVIGIMLCILFLLWQNQKKT